MEKPITGSQLMDQLSVSRDTLALFASCGILNPIAVGTALIYDPDEVRTLKSARRNRVGEDAPQAWIVRLSAPSTEDESGRAIGWHADRADNVDAARMYWRIAEPWNAKGRALVAVVGPLVVGVWNIDDGIRHEDIGRSEFIVSEATTAQRSAYMGERATENDNQRAVGRWLQLRPGPTVLRWPPQSS